MELKGSKTEKNLMAAFSGESEARNKYTYFASVAKKEGYEQLAEIFQKTAELNSILDKYDIETKFDWSEYLIAMGNYFDATR